MYVSDDNLHKGYDVDISTSLCTDCVDGFLGPGATSHRFVRCCMNRRDTRKWFGGTSLSWLISLVSDAVRPLSKSLALLVHTNEVI